MERRRDEGRGFRPLGSLVTTDAASPSGSASMPARSPSTSGTIGPPSRGAGGSSSTGRRRGATGAVARRNDQQVATALLADIRDPARSLPQYVRSALSAVWGDAGSEHGWDGAVIEYEMTASLDEAARWEAIDQAEAMLLPASEDLLLAELARCRSLTASRNAGNDDLTLALSAWVAELERYPGDIVVAELRDWPRAHKFWPTLAEMVEELDRVARPRHLLLAALHRGYRAPEPETGWRLPTEAEREAVEAALIEAGIPRATARSASGRKMELPAMTQADRAQMDAELRAFRARWEAISARAANPTAP